MSLLAVKCATVDDGVLLILQDLQNLQNEIKPIITKALPRLKEELLGEVIDHITSPTVGVSDIEELPSLTAEDLPMLGSVQVRTLLKALKSIGAGPSK